MKKVNLAIQIRIAADYLQRIKYKDIMLRYGVNRWNIQAALSKFDIKTDRIKSHPRLPGNKKVIPGRLMDRYHDGDYLPPLKPKENNPVLLEDDLDIMERMDGTDNADDVIEGSYEMAIDNDGKVVYEKND